MNKLIFTGLLQPRVELLAQELVSIIKESRSRGNKKKSLSSELTLSIDYSEHFSTENYRRNSKNDFFIVLYSLPETYIADRYDGDGPVEIAKNLASWVEQAKSILDFYMNNFDNALLCNMESISADFSSFISHVNKKANLKIDCDKAKVLEIESNSRSLFNYIELASLASMAENYEIHDLCEEILSASDIVNEKLFDYSSRLEKAVLNGSEVIRTIRQEFKKQKDIEDSKLSLSIELEKAQGKLHQSEALLKNAEESIREKGSEIRESSHQIELLKAENKELQSRYQNAITELGELRQEYESFELTNASESELSYLQIGQLQEELELTFEELNKSKSELLAYSQSKQNDEIENELLELQVKQLQEELEFYYEAYSKKDSFKINQNIHEFDIGQFENSVKLMKIIRQS